ncbi:4a-hydroxytetrahydrobiopterin dehydratase [Desmospora profundinema]|uniref:4a-hydroxytetrahydrobiopterin dehydratase n=1 Tax=Desmospora profundinema TaxID=1571184 RepID=A0ABU1IJK4_9BACL|nr:4a-hydroxytetrahydrobiopterin dehydratase [Desmospora profundinema]MDR6224952.1 4a-hydroxytetrahydrobiopterin dehydratase [Desmospora profundinema]
MALSAETVEKRLKENPGWVRSGDRLVRTVPFENYMDGARFIQTIARIAEQENHHPDLMLTVDRVIVSTTTHDAGGITEKDFRLIARIAEVHEA